MFVNYAFTTSNSYFISFSFLVYRVAIIRYKIIIIGFQCLFLFCFSFVCFFNATTCRHSIPAHDWKVTIFGYFVIVIQMQHARKVLSCRNPFIWRRLAARRIYPLFHHREIPIEAMASFHLFIHRQCLGKFRKCYVKESAIPSVLLLIESVIMNINPNYVLITKYHRVSNC